MTTAPVQTRTATVRLGDDGVVRVISNPGVEETIEDARTNLEALHGLVGNKPHAILVDIRRMKSIDRSARRFYAEEPAAKESIRGLAVVVGSPVSKIIGNFVISAFSRSRVAPRLFTREEEALAWLRGLVE